MIAQNTLGNPKISEESIFKSEKELLGMGYGFIVGVDEAGRGPLAGPVVAAATMVRNLEFSISDFSKDAMLGMSNAKMVDLIRDSKSLSCGQREKIFNFIREYFYVGVGICDQRTIDRINILEASFLAMKKAIGSLMRSIKQESEINNQKNKKNKFMARNQEFIVLVDGNKLIPNFSYRQKNIVNGDKLVKSISAASIIAKVTRDRIMFDMHAKYPEYNFDKHKGYGTRLHLEMLKKYGPCEIHRQGFEPVKFAKRRV